MTGLILSAAALLAAWGFFWRLWDRRAVAPMWLFGGAIAGVAIGGLLS